MTIISDTYKVRIKQDKDGTIQCCTQVCDNCAYLGNCEQVSIQILRKEAKDK